LTTVSVIEINGDIKIAHFDSTTVSIEDPDLRTKYNLLFLSHTVAFLIEPTKQYDFILIDLLTT